MQKLLADVGAAQAAQAGAIGGVENWWGQNGAYAQWNYQPTYTLTSGNAVSYNASAVSTNA